MAQDKVKLTTQINTMSLEKNELRKQLKETQSLLKESIRQRDKLKERLDTKTDGGIAGVTSISKPC